MSEERIQVIGWEKPHGEILTGSWVLRSEIEAVVRDRVTMPQVRGELLDAVRTALLFLDEGSPAHDALMALQGGVVIDDRPMTEADIAAGKKLLAEHPEIGETDPSVANRTRDIPDPPREAKVPIDRESPLRAAARELLGACVAITEGPDGPYDRLRASKQWADALAKVRALLGDE